MLARSLANPFTEKIINRLKTGFIIPMAQSLFVFPDKSAWSNLSIISSPNTTWAPPWARVILDKMTKCE